MADEFDQYKVTNAPAGDGFAQYKQTAPGTITGNVATIGQASSSYQPKVSPSGEGEGFIDRMTSRFGQNLEGAGQAILHPIDTLSAMMSAKGNDVGPLDALPKQYAKDPANLAGDVMTAVMGKTVMGSPPGINMANAGKSLSVPVVRPAPLWQTAGTEATSPGFSWQTSTPEEIQAQLSRMASRVKTARPQGAPVEAAVPENAAQKVPLPDQIQPTKATLIDPYRNQALPQMRPATSTTMEAHGYDPTKQQAFVHFKNGNIYRLSGIPPEMYDQFQNAESQGSFYAQNLKGRYQTDLVGKVKATKPSPGQQVKSALSR